MFGGNFTCAGAAGRSALRRARPFVVFSCALLAAGAIARAGTTQWASAWRGDQAVAIDGSDDEWKGDLLGVKGEHFSLAFANDADWLYLCLPTKDRVSKAQIARAGLIVWFDRAGGKKRTFGIHFPAGAPDVFTMGRPPVDRPVPEGEGRGGRGQRKPPEIDHVGGQDEVEILGPKKNDVLPLRLDQAGGITARVGVHADLLVFEMRVPLRKDEQHPYAVDALPGALLRVELQTPEWRGPVPGRRLPIGIGMGRGGAVAFPGVYDSALLTPLDVTLDLRLAAAPPR